MVQGERKVVWILGAGFSVPLGGPLFRDLISPETLRTLRGWEHYKDQARRLKPRSDKRVAVLPVGVLSEIVCCLYLAGRSDKLWGDAEQFLERLEIAASEPTVLLAKDIRKCVRDLPQSQELGSEALDIMKLFQWEVGPDVLHTEAVRFVSGACTAFLLRADENPKVVDESEQWDPYRRWYASLVPGADSVIVFNYDRVPDILEAHGQRARPRRDVFISPVEHDTDSWAAYAPKGVPLYHLHGNVGWKLAGDGRTIDVNAARAAPHRAVAYIDPEQAVIGVPGQTKLSLPSGLLKCLWDPAMAAIETADAIVFVGYRFPETDNMAKRRLIDALKKNRNAVIHVVLGASNPDTSRVHGMLEWTQRRVPVRVHELWAQDFFTVFERQDLLRV
jgi:hypothetical protein